MYHDMQCRLLAIFAALLLSLIAPATAKAGEVIVVTKEQDAFVADLNRRLDCGVGKHLQTCDLKTALGSQVWMVRQSTEGNNYAVTFRPNKVNAPDLFVFRSDGAIAHVEYSKETGREFAVFCYSSMSFKHSSSQCK